MNETLKKLYIEDQSLREHFDQWGKTIPMEEVHAQDTSRRERVQAMIDNGELLDPGDFYNAALIFQHGETPADFEQANKLAEKSMQMGHEPAKWLYAATLDRYLHRTTGQQRFGTQFTAETKEAPWKLVPVDPATTDEMRAEYNVRPYTELLEKERKLNDGSLDP